MPNSKAQAAVSRTDRALNALQAQLDAFRTTLPALRELETKITQRTTSPLLDWVDAVHLVAEPRRRAEWIELGWLPADSASDHEVLRFEGDELPPIVLHANLTARLDLRVENLEAFLRAHGLAFNARIDGAPGCALRRAEWSHSGLRAFGVVERRGSTEFAPRLCPINDPARLEHWSQLLRGRQRAHVDDQQGLAELGELVARAADELGQGPAANLFLTTEREYWQWRNQTARIQHRRQQGLGLGWGNHGKHIYRCSADLFEETQAVFATLGFVYKADESKDADLRRLELAHPESPTRIVLECATGELSAQDPDAIGMWTALHGESLMQAGMHRLCAVLHRAREGECVGGEERWRVDPTRIRDLVRAGLLAAHQGEELLENGAAGSLLASRRD